MDAIQRRLLRVADEIRQCLVDMPISTSLPGRRWPLIQKLASRAQRCQHLGWLRAADHLQRNLRNQLRWLAADLNNLASATQREPPADLRATSAEIFRDLRALHHEFVDVGCDLTAGTLWVVTDSIVLRRVELGRFKIELDFRSLQAFQPYRVIAQQPKTPAGFPRVTHPHVQEDLICEGNGRGAIQATLRSGRIYDFFQIVARLVATYNSGSAFVQLTAWEGVCCTSCGDNVPADDLIRCDRCEKDLCAECASDCKTCGYCFCHECSSSCGGCGGPVCGNCRRKCSQCGSVVCCQCGKDGLCPDCHPSTQENHDESADDDESLAAAAAQGLSE